MSTRLIMLSKLKQGHWPIFLLSSTSSIGNLFLPLILVRVLTTQEVGLYKSFFIHLSILPFLLFVGGPLHSVYYWAGHEHDKQRQYFNASWTLTFFFSILIFIIGFPLRGYLESHFDMSPIYVVILLATGALWSSSSFFSELSIAKGRQALGSIYDTGFEVTKVLGIIYFAVTKKSLLHSIEFFAGLMLFKSVLSAWLNYYVHHVRLEWDKEYLLKVLKYSMPIALTALLGIFVEKYDLLLMSKQLNASEFAFYSLGCLVIPPLYLLEMSVQKILIPKLSKYYRDNNSEESSKAFRKAISDITLFIIPSTLGLIVFAEPIVEILLTAKYLHASIYLRIFALSYLLLALPHDSVARATGETKWILKMYLVVTPISLFLTYYAAGHAGALGALIASIAVKFIPKFFGLTMSKTVMKWRWRDLFPLKHLALYFSLAGSLSILSIFIHNIFPTQILWFLVCGSLFAIIYLGVAYIYLKKDRYATH
ncbi:MAG: oligosaccharide flippase family protein [Bacteriovoracaceae bacterium]|nr:oligosaccharide flippase family protein [Bacteriovoracaceae bacterium]